MSLQQQAYAKRKAPSASCAAGDHAGEPDSLTSSPPSPTAIDAEDGGDEDELRLSPPLLSSFPPGFLRWLSEHDISPFVYTLGASLPRYLRTNPRLPGTVAGLADELGATLQPTPLPSIYAVSTPIRLAASASYKAGRVYGIDLASALSVHALDLPTVRSAREPPAPLHVLDLCAAPGAKLAYAYDLLRASGCPFTLTGVDVSPQRLGTCRNLARKYDLRGVRLCLADGRSFDLPPPSTLCTSSSSPDFVIHDLTHPTSTLRLTKRQKRARRRQLARQGAVDPTLGTSCAAVDAVARVLYDRVLVDAECSHDASVRHVLNFERWGWESMERRLFSEGRISGLQQLQRALIERGWEVLKEGGVLVYSVCSGVREQGEDVVEWLLERYTDAQLCPVFDERDAEEVSEEEALHRIRQLEVGQSLTEDGSSWVKWRWRRARPFQRLQLLQEAVRLDPVCSGTSGLFIARIRKRRMDHPEERQREPAIDRN